MNPSVIHQSFGMNLRIMKLWQVYPPNQPSYCYKFWACLIYFLFVVMVPSLSIVYLLLEENLDMERVNYNAGVVVESTGCITKYLPFIINDRRIKNCIQYWESSFFEVSKKEDLDIMDECIRVCRRNTLVILICGVGAACSWAARPFFWEGRNYPVDVWLPFESTKEMPVYCCIYFFISIGPITLSIWTGAVDPLIAGLAYHATCQLKILKNRLQHLDECSNRELLLDCNQNMTVKKWSKNKIIYARIVKCINHHDAIASFVKEYQTCFSCSVFSQIAASVFVVCFMCLQLSKIEPSGIYFLQMIAYFSVIFAQMYFYCYYGAGLSNESDSLTEAIYMGNWYNYDIKSQKALLILMERSQKPLIVTVGKLVDLSLETFTMILRRSYSLIAFLKNYQ